MESTTPNTQQPKKPRTPAQIAASRNNGRKSKGPKTPEGKAISSQNSTTHGITSAKWLVPTNEKPSAYAGFLAEYLDQWQPANPTERDLVGQMAHAQYTMNRLFAMEAGFLDLAMEEMCPDQVKPLDEPMRQTIAFKALADSTNGLSLLNRYLARCERMYHRALHSLMDLRKLQAAEAKASQPKQSKSGQTNPSPTPSGAHLPWTDPFNRTSEAIHLRMNTPNLPDPPSPPPAG